MSMCSSSGGQSSSGGEPGSWVGVEATSGGCSSGSCTCICIYANRKTLAGE